MKEDEVVMTPMLKDQLKKAESLRTVATVSSLLTSDSVEDGIELIAGGFVPLDNISELSFSEKVEDESDEDTEEVGWYDPAYIDPDARKPKVMEETQSKHRATGGNAVFYNVLYFALTEVLWLIKCYAISASCLLKSPNFTKRLQKASCLIVRRTYQLVIVFKGSLCSRYQKV